MRCLLLEKDDIWIVKAGEETRIFFDLTDLPEVHEMVAPGICTGERSAPPAEDAVKINLRCLFDLCGDNAFQLAGRARQLLHWRATHKFCGACGSALSRHESECAMICRECGEIFYPRINPVVITLIHRGREILLARRSDPHYSHFWSAVAGFVEAGESLEDTVRREIREEVGIEVRNIRHLSSQQWPFPNNLMIGFFAEYDSGEPQPDGTEIAEAAWFTLETLPPIPSKVSIARKLIDHFFAHSGGIRRPQ